MFPVLAAIHETLRRGGGEICRHALSPLAACVVKRLEFVSKICGVKFWGIRPSKDRLQFWICAEIIDSKTVRRIEKQNFRYIVAEAVISSFFWEE